ncbi:ChbG/HpnK family deacetylase [Mesorhizobium sp. M0435]|uniref:ChbG/HpnK family deacetylase n=1 Tax=unclassified Mesorhizobium TaxID=325217 RepID=UPI003337A63C
MATTRRKAVPQAIEAELRAQIDTAYRAGIDVTHLDAHMGAALSPEFCDIYIKLGLEYQLPVLLTKTLSAYSPNDNLVGVTEEAFQRGVALARAGGFAIFDAAIQTTWGRPRSRPIEPVYKALIEGVREGLTFFCLHCNAPGELELIEPRSAYIRTEEYELFRDQGFRDWLAAQPIDVIGMKPLREELRAALSAGRSSTSARGNNAGEQRLTSAKARKAATRSAT